MGLAMAGTASQAQTVPAKPFLMGIDENGTPEGSYTARLFPAIYAEAFRRLQVPLEFVRYPTARLPAMLEGGAIDGDMARAVGFGEAHPNLVRVGESTRDAFFALYTANPDLKPFPLADLAGGSQRLLYRVGVLFCENTLKRLLPPDRLSTITSPQLGLRMLALGRADLYCDIDLAVANQLMSPEFKGQRLRKLMDLGDPAPLYAYLAPKHAELAQNLARTLRQMKREGWIDRLDRDILRDMGR
jgi:hypothetical protein